MLQNIAIIANPLSRLLKKRTPASLQLYDEQRDASDTFIEIICSPLSLALPKTGLPYSVDCDTTDYGVSCAHFQTRLNGERSPIGF